MSEDEKAAPRRRRAARKAAPHLTVVPTPERGGEGDGPQMTARTARIERARIEAAAVADLNTTHAAVMVGGQALVVVDRGDDGFALTTFRALSDWLACRPLHVPEWNDKTGTVETKRVDRAMLWRGHPDRRNVRGLTFAPGADLGGDHFNLWRGWGIQPVRDGGTAARPIIDHISEVWCGGDDTTTHWVLSWLAQMVQQPCAKPGTALVLRGEEGTGKGVIAGQLMRRIIGSAFVQILHPGQVVGRFNSVWQSKLLAFCDESFWAGDKPAEGVLKGLITEPKLVVEFKGREAFEIDHHARVIFASNNDWVVPAGVTARRYAVLDVSSRRRGDRAYYARLSDAVQGDGAASFFGFLLDYDIAGVDLRSPPVTAALLSQKVMSLDSVASWWRERLWAGFIDNPSPTGLDDLGPKEWPDVVSCGRLYGSYAAYCKRVAVRYPDGEEAMARKLRQFARVERKRGASDGTGHRPWVYAFQTPDASTLHGLRGQFERWIGGPLDWEGDDPADQPHASEGEGGSDAPF